MTNVTLTDLQTRIRHNPAHSYGFLSLECYNPPFLRSFQTLLASIKILFGLEERRPSNSRRMDSGVLFPFIKEIPGSLLCGGRCFYGRSRLGTVDSLSRCTGDVAVKPLLRSRSTYDCDT
ncbi:hypothetical protein CEXT_658351 [Caerostris extrusa]|uniref:Uncharacterized protein n=1 Tax=Caerostris extrusa TaxID=172846 RepID=A0AAV4R4V7_CAEEX|nr:hypothetical protein CEXT_658351 [Caerostris extrusa]